MTNKHSTNQSCIIGKICPGYNHKVHWCPLNGFHKNNSNKDGLGCWCKDCEKNYQRLDKTKKRHSEYSKSLEGKFRAYKSRSKRKKLNFGLTFEEFCLLCTQPCHYCDEIKLHSNGIDRIDSDKGYSTDNCVPCCPMCNFMKSNTTSKDFIDKCKLIVNKEKLGRQNNAK